MDPQPDESLAPAHRLPRFVAVGPLGALIVAAAITVTAVVQAGDNGQLTPNNAIPTVDALSGSNTPDVSRSRFAPADAAALAALAQTGGRTVDATGALHKHVAGSPADLTPDQREELGAQLALAAQAITYYDSVTDAAAAGYVQVSSSAEGVGAHWVKWSLVDQPFNPQIPSQLLFEEIRSGEGPELVAFSYWVLSEDEPEGFAGDTDRWHQHFGLCFEDGWAKTENNPDPASCDGDWINGGNIWMLHAWIVPGMENTLGVFHNVNPRLCERFCD